MTGCLPRGSGKFGRSLSRAANAKFRDARPVFNPGLPLVELQTDFRLGIGRRWHITFPRLAPFVRARRAELPADSVAFDHKAQSDGERVQRYDRDGPRLVILF